MERTASITVLFKDGQTSPPANTVLKPTHLSDPAALVSLFRQPATQPQAPNSGPNASLITYQAFRAAFALKRNSPEACLGTPWPAAKFYQASLPPCMFLLGLIIVAPLFTLKACALCLSLGFIALSLFRLSATLSTPLKASFPARQPDHSLPKVSLILALYQEANSVEDLIGALKKLDYPDDKVEILLAIEQDDVETLSRAALAILKDKRFRLIPIPLIGPRTKPKALNFAYLQSRGDIIAVYDAEDAPHPQQIRHAAAAFAQNPKLGCVQAPLGWYNAHENWLTRQFTMEYAAHFHVILPYFSRLGWALPLGGTSNFFRRQALDEVCAWDPFNVTEDADLGFRLVKAGWQLDMIAPGTLEEAPLTLEAWLKQRSRWLKGHALTWRIHVQRNAKGEPMAYKDQAALHLCLGAGVLSALIHAPTLLAIPTGLVYALLRPQPSALLLLSVITVAICGLSHLWILQTGLKRAQMKVGLWTLLSAFAYWPLQSLAAWRALRELLTAPYLWQKTTHGQSKHNRHAPH
ncbi:glycosyltransferase [Woodsholea maritima]|uniref:glycosyltransferase n=1 Tax=Woodsholea maritima TaxID=240237 RepID=UPI00037BB41C|nr:glycosyltransferase [Woodsholea maritima]